MKLKPPKRIGFYAPKRSDKIHQMLCRIARQITCQADLDRASMDIPPYAREDWLRSVAPYLRFTPVGGGQPVTADNARQPDGTGAG